MMAILKELDTELKLFEGTDPYHFATDNRPLRELQTNILALNDQVEDIEESDCEVATFIFESPSVEAFGGRYIVRENAGEIVRVVLSLSTAGTSGNLTADVDIEGTTVFTTPANRPSFAYDAGTQWTERTGGQLENKGVLAGDEITVEIIEAPGGTPRWARLDVYIRKQQDRDDGGTLYDASQYTGGG
jgi:hypothetical protein